jgi:tripartite-type tricarboxylate transporter receptor subunit TctC
MKLASTAAALALSFATFSTAEAQPAPAPFPANKPVSVYVGTAPGGTNDLIMRIAVRHIGKYLPGKPQVIPRNMPGAGGVALANYLYGAAPRDGSEIGVVQRAVSVMPLVVDPTMKVRMDELTWLSTPTESTDVCMVWHAAPVKTLADIQTTELILAGSGGETAQVRSLQKLTGGKVRTVIGYPVGAQMNLAIERGEVHGRCAISWEALKSNYPEWLADKKVNLLVQYGYQRHKELPNVPVISDFARSTEEKEAINILLLPQGVGFPFMGPPGLLPEVRDMWRKAFEQVWKDPETIAEAERIKLELAPVPGEELQKRVQATYASSPKAIALAKELIAEEGK